MNRSRAVPRRQLPGSPFNVREVVRPVECYAVDDQVTHDKYGLGRVVAIEGEVAVVVDFGSHTARIRMPCAKLTRL